MDAFYEALETLSNTSLKGKPVAIGGMSMLSTANYEVQNAFFLLLQLLGNAYHTELLIKVVDRKIIELEVIRDLSKIDRIYTWMLFMKLLRP
ncbi:DNA polymerase kappa [Artemisia annua]|uniref:DNA polymerase kappa n=1 Tax=Artemisia annua TaxID=35608 RepID=A0A2U1ML01_ARTAN|nr:DNA polymerase kappa [Artemisia annua]